MDKRHLSPKELSVFKLKIVEAVEEGFSQAHVSKLFGFTPTTVSKYIRDYKKRGKESIEVVARGRKTGEKRKIGKSEEAEIQETIDKKTPDEVGLDCVLWGCRKTPRKKCNVSNFKKITPKIQKLCQKDDYFCRFWVKVPILGTVHPWARYAPWKRGGELIETSRLTLWTMASIKN